LIYSTSLAANAHVQSKGGRPAGEIRVILQFTPSGAQPGMPTVMSGSVRPPTAPYAPYVGPLPFGTPAAIYMPPPSQPPPLVQPSHPQFTSVGSGGTQAAVPSKAASLPEPMPYGLLHVTLVDGQIKKSSKLQFHNHLMSVAIIAYKTMRLECFIVFEQYK
jgi:hypothetical protein